ncbi:MAG: DUF2961 domain-containing protein, partial [Planctomycetaceae bacterium]|nr:DUF2961 domain-containing protein [Planctomycetaceae bacterium]
VDGRLVFHGTGMKDNFQRGGNALPGRADRPACYPLHGFPVYRQEGQAWQAAAYCWHLSDPVPYTRTIDVGLVHNGENTTATSYRAAVFWYSQRPGPVQAAR